MFKSLRAVTFVDVLCGNIYLKVNKFNDVWLQPCGTSFDTHGRVVTSSCQMTEVEQRRARLVLGWVTGARVMLPAMCRGVWQASHIMPPLSTQ